LGCVPWSPRFFREADQEEASEDNDDGLVDMDDEEDKDESSFDERLGGSCSATTLRPPTPWPRSPPCA